MIILDKVKEMFGFKHKELTHDALQAQVSKALQRNEQAGEQARRTLEEMTCTINDIVGRMK